MGIRFTQGLGIIFIILGVVLVMGLDWLGIWAVGIGVILIIFGFYLARHIFDEKHKDESRFIHDNTHSDD